MCSPSQIFNGQCPSHIETSQLICPANQLTGFYVGGTLTVKELNLKIESKLQPTRFHSDSIPKNLPKFVRKFTIVKFSKVLSDFEKHKLKCFLLALH